MNIENEHTFEKSLKQGINLFVGAGFSVLAKDSLDRPLPTGSDLAIELVAEFNVPNAQSLGLSKISTILEHDCKQDFYKYIRKRFTVSEFDDRYFLLDKINLKTIFSTNVDDLVHKVYATSSTHYVNDTSLRGPVFGDRAAIDLVTLHGCVLDKNRPMSFGSRDVAAAFNADPDSWRFLTNQLHAHPTIFWGHSIEDAAVLEALNPSIIRGKLQKDRWIVLPPATDQGTIQFFRALDFQIIMADTDQMLSYLDGLGMKPAEIIVSAPGVSTRDVFLQEAIPEIGTTPVRPVIDFYQGAAPSWHDIYYANLYRTAHFAKICDSINSGKHTVVIGLPACGKTTLLMQVAADISFSGHKLVSDFMSQEKARLIMTKLGTYNALIFIDNVTDSVDAFRFFSRQANVQLVGFDRDYNFDIVSHKIDMSRCKMLDVTELSAHDVQEIFSRIPQNIKNPAYRAPEVSEGMLPSLFEVIESNVTTNNLRDRFRSVVQELTQEDVNLLDLLLVSCYVHKCHTPISMDMLLAFFHGLGVGYDEIYSMCERIGAMLSDYVGELADDEQDYFVPRSKIVAEAVIGQAPAFALKRVLLRFHENVSRYRIHRFDIFRRQGYDAGLIRRAFANWEEGLQFYKIVCSRDPSPFLRQQCALYLGQKRRFTEAFEWIDEAIMLSGGRIPSIRNSHAIILFKANIDRLETDGTVQRTLQESMQILSECYKYDKRKIYHARVFADQALRYFEVYGDEVANEYLETAKKWLEEEARKSPWDRGVKYLLRKVRTKLTR